MALFQLTTFCNTAAVEPVAQALSDLRQMNVWLRDAYEREIDIQNESTFVFKLRGHPWNLVYQTYLQPRQIYS